MTKEEIQARINHIKEWCYNEPMDAIQLNEAWEEINKLEKLLSDG